VSGGGGNNPLNNVQQKCQIWIYPNKIKCTCFWRYLWFHYFKFQYYLIAELLILKYWWQNILVSNIALLLQSLVRKWRYVMRTRSTFSRSVMVSVAVSSLGHTDLFFIVIIDQSTKVNGQYYRDVLLHQQFLPAIHDVSGDFFTFQKDNTPAHRAHETMQLLTCKTPDFITPVLWPEPGRLPAGACVSQPDSWRWPAEVTPDRRVGTFPPGVHRWSDQAEASTFSSLHSSTRRAFRTQTLVMFDICTDVHFDSHMSVRLHIVDTFVSGWLQLTHYNYCKCWQILLKFGHLFAIRHCIVGPEFC